MVDKLIGLRAFGDDGMSITLLPSASDWRREGEVFTTLRDIANRIDSNPHIRKLVIDCQHITHIPEEARGAIVRLLMLFHERQGTVLCSASDSVTAPFAMMRMTEFFRQAESLNLPRATAGISEACDEIAGQIDVQRLEEEQLQHCEGRRAYEPRSIQCNGNLVFYSIEGNTALVQLNADVLSLDEEAGIAARFREAVSTVADAEPVVERVVLNLRGLEFIGAEPIGALISMHNAGKQGKGARLALSNLEPPVAEKLTLTRLDRLFTIFSEAVEALQASW